MPETAELESVRESEHSYFALAARQPGTGDASLAIPGLDGGSLGAPVLQLQANAGVRAIATRQAQRTNGNRFAQRAISPPAVQRSCACGGTCEKCSQQAAMPVSSEMELVQPQSHSPAVDNASVDRLKPASSAGDPLRPDTRRSMESHFGSDLSNVRVHTGSPAALAAGSIHADAYTIGSDIYFAAGKYQPESVQGRKLIAHEITHVLQQAEGRTPTHSLPLRYGDVVIGAPEDALEQEANRNSEAFGREPVSSPVAEVSGKTTAPSMAQRDAGDKGHEDETFEGFKGRVFDRAIMRLERNIRALNEWRTFITKLKGFQLRAQLISTEMAEYAMVASQQVKGGEKFETMVGTHSAGEQAYLESTFAVDATLREKGLGYVAFLRDKALGYYTVPSVAERMQVVQGTKAEQDLSHSHYVPPAQGYEFYAPVVGSFQEGISGCQFCHDLNQARQKTIEVYGAAEPKPMKMPDFGPLLNSQQYRMAGSMPPFGRKPDDTQAIAEAMGWVNSVTAKRDPQQETGPPMTATQGPEKTVAPKSFLPEIPLPANVEPPIPRSNLCGELPPPQADGPDYLTQASGWGGNSAIVVDAIRSIGAVLQPLGPFGYRIIPRQTFNQLWKAGPDEMEVVRADILQNLANRQNDYLTLQGKIMFGDVPYDELCPVVDELLPTTNPMVRSHVQIDIAMKRAQEAVLDALLKIVGAALLLLAIFFPPSIMLSAPVIAAGVGVSLAGIAVGARDYRRGRQTALSVGSHLHSRAEEDAADSLAFWGIVNVVTSLIGLWQFRSLSVAAAEAKGGAAVLEDVHPTGVPEKVPEGPGAPHDLPGEGGPKVVPDADTTAKPGDFSAEQLETANNKLSERINNPEKVREVSDPDLAKDYDLEVELDDGQIYRRKKGGGKWCLFRNPKLCGVEPGPAVEQAANTQKSLLQAEAKVEGEVGPGTRLGKLRDSFKKMVAKDAKLQKLSPAKQAKLLNSLEQRLIRRALDRFPPGYIADEEAMRAYLRNNPEDLDRMLDADLAWNDTGDPASWEVQVEARQAKKLAEAKELISGENKFFDPHIEERYQNYLKRKASVKETPRERADWKVASDAAVTESPYARGNRFNELRRPSFDYSEVELESGYRVDSYNDGTEIISRKDTDFDLIERDSFEAYLKELKNKYYKGAKINSPKYAKPSKSPVDGRELPPIHGKELQGKQFLEVPVSNKNAVNCGAFEEAAEKQGITIIYG